MPKTVLSFLILGGLFALTHAFATVTSLYWYYPWFDTVMHFWGGLLIVLGIHALVRLGFPVKTNKRTIFSVALLFMISWEIFEYNIGLVRESGHLLDTIKDIFIGSSGVIIGYIVLKLRNK